jgi:hypothetical protein
MPDAGISILSCRNNVAFVYTSNTTTRTKCVSPIPATNLPLSQKLTNFAFYIQYKCGIIFAYAYDTRLYQAMKFRHGVLGGVDRHCVYHRQNSCKKEIICFAEK